MKNVSLSPPPPSQLLSIISSDQLSISKEESVYTAVMDWVKHCSNERRQYVPKVGDFWRKKNCWLVGLLLLFYFFFLVSRTHSISVNATRIPHELRRTGKFSQR